MWRKAFSISEVSFLSFGPTKTRRAEVNAAERWPRVISFYSNSPLHFVWTGESPSLRRCNGPSCRAWGRGPDIYPWRRDKYCARPKNKESWRRWCLLFVKANGSQISSELSVLDLAHWYFEQRRTSFLWCEQLLDLMFEAPDTASDSDIPTLSLWLGRFTECGTVTACSLCVKHFVKTAQHLRTTTYRGSEHHSVLGLNSHLKAGVTLKKRPWFYGVKGAETHMRW